MGRSHERRAVGALLWVSASLALLLIAGAWALRLSGDLNEDEEFDAPDVVLSVETLASPEALSATERLAADVNQDNQIDADDPARVAEIIVGLKVPLPLGGLPVDAQGASFWFQASPDVAVSGEDTQPQGAVSFWKRSVFEPTPDSVDVSLLGTASFWFRAAQDPAITDQDAVALGSVSFWFEADANPEINETNVVTLGSPSFQRDL